MLPLLQSSFSAEAATGEYRTWLQGDSRWGSMELGTSGKTMSSIGCAATTLSKLIVHSGAASETSFNPGVLCSYMSANGGFDGVGNIYWGKITGLIPSFTFEGYRSIAATTLSGKAAELKAYIDDGYYLGVSVRNQGHWVAVDYIQGDTVAIMDPASNSKTDLFAAYDYAGVTQVRLFRGPNPPPTGGSGTIPAEPEVPAKPYYTGHYMTLSNVNLREGAGTDYGILTLVSNSTVVNVFAVSGAWGKISYNEKTGWVCLNFTQYIESQYTYPTGTYSIDVNDGLYVRSGVGSTNAAIGMLAANDVVEVLAVQDGWGQILYQGTLGWICMDYTIYMGETLPVIPEQTPVPGDLNHNGVLDQADVSLLNEYLLNKRVLTDAELLLADVNEDGMISQLDVITLQIRGQNLG